MYIHRLSRAHRRLPPSEREIIQHSSHIPLPLSGRNRFSDLLVTKASNRERALFPGIGSLSPSGDRERCPVSCNRLVGPIRQR